VLLMTAFAMKSTGQLGRGYNKCNVTFSNFVAFFQWWEQLTERISTSQSLGTVQKIIIITLSLGGYTLNCQVVVDSNKQFLDLYLGIPGSTNDASVL
jgi:hypothetical protein